MSKSSTVYLVLFLHCLIHDAINKTYSNQSPTRDNRASNKRHFTTKEHYNSVSSSLDLDRPLRGLPLSKTICPAQLGSTSLIRLSCLTS